ncbi:MAG: SGNH/GDSL hydrolase family protein [Planctomycetota bacterium]
MKRWLFRLALLALGIVVALLALEVFLRVFDPGRYRELEEREAFSERVLRRDADGVLRLRPGVETTFLGKRVAISAIGLRNPPVVVPKPADVYRIVVVGDSVPFGWGVGEDEAFPRLLERELQREPRTDGRRIEVVNAGIPGFGLVEEYVWLRDHGLAMAPDLVVHCVIANDVEPPPGMPKLILTPALRRVRTLRLVERMVEKVGGSSAVDPAAGITPQQLVFSIDRFVELCRSVGATYVFMDTVAVPDAVRHCQERGIDRTDCFISVAWIDAHRVRPTDFHPDADGHRWLAARVLPVVRDVANR